MTLLVGLTCLCLATVAFCVLLLGCRAPHQPRWCSDSLVANVYVPLLIGVGVYGVSDLIHFALTSQGQPVSPVTLAAAAGVVVATLALIKGLRLQKTLAAYAAVVGLAPGSAPGEEPPVPPARPGRSRLAA